MKKMAGILVKILQFISKVTEFLFAFLEQHMTKVVSVSIMALCCYNVNALHFVIVLVLIISIPCGVTLLNQSFRFIGIYIACLLLTKMVYQTNFFPKGPNSALQCQNVSKSITDWRKFSIKDWGDTNWLGYYALKDGESIARLLRSYLLVLLVMTFQTVLYVRQKITRIDAGKSPNIPPVLFPKIHRKHADVNLTKCAQFLLNYGFYKFGVEATLTMCAFVISFRTDILSAIYSMWLAILVPLSRQRIARAWPFFMISVMISILCQYSMALGLPSKSCIKYPWSDCEQLKEWLFLASHMNPPKAKKIIADFVLFIFISRQRVVFEIEKKLDDLYSGGSNKPVYMEFYKPGFLNPIPDHTLYTKSTLDIVKKILLASLYWITLTVVFWTGVNNVNILSLGYLAGAFVFLWLGYDLYLWHIKKILKWWNFLLGYSVFVILVKSLHELMGCVYFQYFTTNACWFVQLLNFGCSSNVIDPALSSCRVNVNTDMYSDMACFALILFERRYFHSYYFLHQLDDIQASVGLQAKGAALIESLRQEKEQAQEERERKTLMKIKKNMNRIKAWQKKMHGLKYYEPTDHATAVRMGDYVMFEDPEELRSRLERSSSDSDEDSDKKKDRDRWNEDKKLTMTEFIGTVFKKVTEEGVSGKTVKSRKETTVSFRESLISKQEKSSKTPTSPYQRTGTFPLTTETSDKSPKPLGTDEEVQSEKLLERKAKSVWDFVSNFFESVVVSIILFLNKYSSDYRFVEQAMNEERKKTKIHREKTRSFLFSPSLTALPSYRRSDQKIEDEEDPSEKFSFTERDLSDKNKKLWMDLVVSVFYFIMSNTELLCYIAVIIHQLISPTILSLPLPLLIFLWGSLTAVRPTTTFWIILIGYTETTVLIKALFQNWFFPWNSVDTVTGLRSYHPPVLMGIHRDNKYATADLMLLLMLFLHRYKLKTLGLWKAANEEDYSRPQNLRIYCEIEPDLKNQDADFRYGNLSRNSVILSESTDIFLSAHLARWKCASRVMAKINHRGNVEGLCIREMPGNILVTHEGRYLVPTDASLAHISQETLANNIVLRVYSSEEFDDARKLYCKMSLLQHFTSIRKFFVQITNKVRRVSSDFYTLMFFFDFLTFLIILAGYRSFTESQITKAADFYIAENQVPLPYLFTLLIHFLVILADRILYLKKKIEGKLILHIFLVLIVHTWMFLVLPKVTETSFNSLVLPPIWYVLKCLYFLMSAYQIRVGYPVRVQGHFVCKKYNYVNYYFFKILQCLPFFNQLRHIIDYVCIPSSFTFSEWIKMESIYQIVFESKCMRRSEIDYPAPRGKECPRTTKLCPGIWCLVLIVLVMWLPFLVFAIFEAVYVPNLPKSASIEIMFGSLGKIFTTTSNFENIIPFTESQFETLQSIYKDDNKVWAFLSRYSYDDVAVLKFRIDPLEPWNALPEAETRLKNAIKNQSLDITLSVVWKIERTELSQMVANPVIGSRAKTLNGTSEERRNLMNLMDGKQSVVIIRDMIPKFIKISNEGDASGVPTANSLEYRNISLELKIDANNKNIKWWEVKEIFDEVLDKFKVSQVPHYETKDITMYTFNEKNIPKMFRYFILNKGIIGFYVSFVLVMWTFIRRTMNKYPGIMFEDMPNIDPVLQLCHDIYLARENLEFALEEDLYAKLLFLFRSPETMIKWTRLSTERRIQIDSDLY